jgi:hypothetical protein
MSITNARMFMFLPIEFELVTTAIAGSTSIAILSVWPSPIKDGEKFYFVVPGAPGETEIEVVGDQIILDGLPTTLIIKPLPAGVSAGTKTLDRRHPRTGNRLEQTILVERFASVELKKPRPEAGVEWAGNTQTIEQVLGRWRKPSLTEYPWSSSDMTMQYQRDQVSYVEGTFKAFSVNQSRLRTDIFFGDRCHGEFLSDARPRAVRGVISDGCC